MARSLPTAPPAPGFPGGTMPPALLAEAGPQPRRRRQCPLSPAGAPTPASSPKRGPNPAGAV
ncbi:MAG: hypothetical protein M3Q48_06925, partial [Actinomycetota bacterium]|nr:hypothetical protein [Actinomycetota bacterium]